MIECLCVVSHLDQFLSHQLFDSPVGTKELVGEKQESAESEEISDSESGMDSCLSLSGEEQPDGVEPLQNKPVAKEPKQEVHEQQEVLKLQEVKEPWKIHEPQEVQKSERQQEVHHELKMGLVGEVRSPKERNLVVEQVESPGDVHSELETDEESFTDEEEVGVVRDVQPQSDTPSLVQPAQLDQQQQQQQQKVYIICLLVL